MVRPLNQCRTEIFPLPGELRCGPRCACRRLQAPDHSSLDSLLERRGFELSVPSPETRNAENKGWRREQWSLTPLGPRVRIRLPPGMSPRTSGPSSEAVAASILHLLRNCPVLGAEVRTRDHATATPAASRSRAIAGTSTRWSCGSLASGCSCGVPSITRVRFSTCWSSVDATVGQHFG